MKTPFELNKMSPEVPTYVLAINTTNFIYSIVTSFCLLFIIHNSSQISIDGQFILIFSI